MERCFNKLKQHRAVATRHDKREHIYQDTIDVASIPEPRGADPPPVISQDSQASPQQGSQGMIRKHSYAA